MEAHKKDLRHLLWASIDNDDSRDLDQLTVAETLPDNRVRIFVAVADVDALVKKASAIDPPARVVPLLSYACHACRLAPALGRLAAS